MNDESRTVRDLLDANLRLTDQFIELARLAIGAPVEARPQENTYAPDTSSPEFSFGAEDNWEDIPDRPLGGGAEILEIPRREPELVLPLHMSEEEEDLRHAVAMGQRSSSDLSDLLKKLGTPGDEVVEFIAPE